MAPVRGVEQDIYVAGDIEGQQDILFLSPDHRINTLRMYDEEGSWMIRKEYEGANMVAVLFWTNT